MITVRHLGGRRRGVFTSMRGLGLGLEPLPQLDVTLPSGAVRSAIPTRLPPSVRAQASLNMPRIAPTLDAGAVRNLPRPAAEGVIDDGMVGDDGTRTVFAVLEHEAGGTGTHEFATDDAGRYLDSEGRPIDSVSPGVAPQGDFIKTWGPPLLAVAGIGLAVWILRR